MAEDQPTDQEAHGDVDRGRDRPGGHEHGLRNVVEKGEIDRQGRQNPADGRDDRQHRASPRVQHAAAQRLFDDLLGHDAKEQRQTDVVDDEVHGV